MLEGGVRGLGAEGAFESVGFLLLVFCWRGGGGKVQGIAEKTQGEDREGEGVAGALGVAVEEAGEGFMVVFYIYEFILFLWQWVEEDRARGDRGSLPRRATVLSGRIRPAGKV